MPKIDYRRFIQDNFRIRNKKGEEIPFIFNGVQNRYYDILTEEYPDMQGIRENDLKARQEGFSSIIDAILTADFIMAELGHIPAVGGQIISHKEADTKPLFRRVDLFIDSFLQKANIDRKAFLKTDNKVSYIEGFRGSELFVGTAGAKTLGRGGTLQNIHWSECGFYPNTPVLNSRDLVIGAEQQVADGIGKIFRESTGESRIGFWPEEYFAGKEGLGDFRSRFFPWFENPEYSRPVPDGYIIQAEWEAKRKRFGLTREQIYWYIKKIESKLKPTERAKMVREYPFEDREAFLSSGSCYFDVNILNKYLSNTIEPMKEDLMYPSDPMLKQYRPIEKGEFFLVFADCSQGGSDANHVKFLSRNKLDFPLMHHRHGVAANMTEDIFPILEKIYDITGVPPTVAFERNNGGGSEMERLSSLNRSGKFNIFVMPKIGYGKSGGDEEKKDDDKEEEEDEKEKKLGWDTNKTTRPIMCGDGRNSIESKSFTIYDKETIEEMFTFIINERTGKPEADRGAHDDRVMSFFGTVQLFNRVSPPVTTKKKDYKQWDNFKQPEEFSL